MTGPARAQVSLRQVALEWARIGLIGFGGPPAHIRLLRRLTVERQGWVTGTEFEDGVAATGLLPGPASTQLAIYLAWRVAGAAGAVVGGLCFILPGLVLILALSVFVLSGSAPEALRAAAAGAGAAVAPVALYAASDLVPASWRRSVAHDRRTVSGARARWLTYVVAGAATAAWAGAWVVVALLGCGVVELVLRHGRPTSGALAVVVLPHAVLRSTGSWVAGAVRLGATAGLGALAWTAFKVGALSYGGGFVIVPLMRSDVVGHHHWLSPTQFLDAVALGQVTPGPVVLTVAAVGYAVAGIGGGLLAAAVAFGPSFGFVLGGAGRFDRVRRSGRARAFLDGAGPAAIGAIAGSAIPLASGLQRWWEYAIAAAAAAWLLVARRGLVWVILLAAVAGLVAVEAGLGMVR